MSRKPLTKEQILAALAEVPATIAVITNGLTEAQLHTSPGDEQWSVNEVLAHLRSCADVWGNCIVTIINKDIPTIRAIDPRTWIRRTNYPDLEFRVSLEAYTGQRSELLDGLKYLEPDDWFRTAIVTGAGKPLERTVYFYAQWLAHHERPHLKQIRNVADVVCKLG